MKQTLLVQFFSLGFLTVLSTAQMERSPCVTRISLIQGDVSMQRGDIGGWAAAALNEPLVGGDSISTENNSKAELQLDHANILRLGSNSQAKIATVEQTQNQRGQIQVQIGHGLVYYTIFKGSDAEVEIDTPNAAIRPTSKYGIYRVEVNGFETQVIVRAGSVDMVTPHGSAHVETGQGATVRGTTHDAGSVLGGATTLDRWDSWNVDRDRVIRNAKSWDFTNRYYVGSEDLDAYGHWVDVPNYGQVWSPLVGADWTPYRAGRWLWEPYWGWTWVSNEPWGWTPYHYGRWLLNGKSWMWWPGKVHGGGNDRPEWAPAYVSFFALGGHPGASVGFESVGWLPLGPGDSFYPWYGPEETRLKVASAPDTTNITRLTTRLTRVVAPIRNDNNFSNLSLATLDGRIRKAISTLPADHFGTGRSAPRAVGERAFREGRIITGNVPIVPTKEMLAATSSPVKESPMLNSGRQYFTMKQPAVPQPFDEEATQVKESIAETGQLVPAREVTHQDSTHIVRPLALVSGVERTIELTKDPQSKHKSRSQSQVGVRISSSPRMSIRGMTSAFAYRGAKTRATSGPGGNFHPAVSLRVPAATSTRRVTTLATASSGSVARAAQSYIDSAGRQMDKGNYTAAIANYKRALQVDRSSSAANAYLARARRAMQAENEIMASRR